MRPSPFYAYPFQPPHPFSTPSAHNAFRQYRPLSPSAPGSARTSTRPVINIPVHDSAPSPPPPSSPRPVNPPPEPSMPAAGAPNSTSPPPPQTDHASAATTIQSHFRGFSIRRRRPLLHLRSIARARKQLEELKLELESPGFAPKVRASDKERLRFSESVMAVILRLDAVEGSIPEVRSQRKEATKMAIKLQDAIDAIMMQPDEISDPKPRDAALSYVGTAKEDDALHHKKIEGPLYCDDTNMDMVQDGGMPTMLGDGALPYAGTAEGDDTSDCKQTEESLRCDDIYMAQELMPPMVGGRPTSVRLMPT